MVEELLKIAVDYGKLVDVVDKLKELIEDKRSQLEELLKLYPLAKPLYTDLIENTRSTLEKLEELKRVYVKYYSQTYS
jgi:predicted transcriptional regulator